MRSDGMKHMALLFVVMLCSRTAFGHAFAPILLEIVEHDNEVQLIWKEAVIGVGNAGTVDLSPTISPSCTANTAHIITQVGITVISRWTIDCGDQGLRGRMISVANLRESGRTIFVRYIDRDATVHSYLLNGANNEVKLQAAADSTGAVDKSVNAYLALGVEHILSGYDHLLFVLCLMFLVGKQMRNLLIAITSFTAGHSLTLGLAVFDVVRLPSPVVEPLIAFSIVLLAKEFLVQRFNSKPGRRNYGFIAMCMGLLHGLGFASVLLAIGLPRENLVGALFLFNVGVEVGQVIFILAVMLVMYIAPSFRTSQLSRIAAYSAGTIAAFWFWGGLANLYSLGNHDHDNTRHARQSQRPTARVESHLTATGNYPINY
jgi:hypothetical protein